ncbi:MAG: UDP-N-acetylglucosamine 2-epimerase [Acidimicrobiales bacterium]
MPGSGSLMEAGLRSRNLLHPFPEELIRIFVMRFADICFAPTPDAVENLLSTRHRGEIIALDGNTSIEAVSHATATGDTVTSGPAVVTMHRVENLRNAKRVEGWLSAVEKVADRYDVRFVMHEPTRKVLEPIGGLDRLRKAGVEVSPLISHTEFVGLLSAAPLAIIDGGSIQEECGYLGLPTLLWRDHTEREHGIGRNVVLSHFDQDVVDRFLDELEELRQPAQLPDVTPSVQILDELLARLG